MDDELLFETVDPRGYRVVLSAERYYGHIISSDGGHNPHPEFSPDEIKNQSQFGKGENLTARSISQKHLRNTRRYS